METPNTLYHYCSVETFLKIIECKTLRLCNIFESNDYMEREWIDRFIEDELNGLGEKYKGFSSSLRDLYYRNKKHPVYVMAFCEKGDLLSQWRGYSEDGAGFALGIDIKNIALEHEFLVGPPCPSTDDKNTIGYWEVIYDVDLQKQHVADIIKRNLADDPSDKIQYLLKTFQAADGLIRWSAVTKNPAFSEEKEWRIMYTPRIDDTGIHGAIKDVKFIKKRNIISTCFELNFSQRSTLNEVILGPKNLTDPKTVKLLLKNKGYDTTNIKISKSNLSYR